MESLDSLPRLVCLSDVAPYQVGGGALVLHRLLSEYPAEKLLVLSPDRTDFAPSSKLKKVRYESLNYKIPKWIFNRLNPAWPIFMSRYIRKLDNRARSLCRDFEAEVVLSVAHDYLWFVAGSVARKLKLPVHLILHDDWPYLQTLAPKPWIRPFILPLCEKTAGREFRRANHLYAVGPGMADAYAKLYKVQCSVLYPSRGTDSPSAQVRVQSESPRQPTMVYAGMIHQGWVIEALRRVAHAIRPLNGVLDIYSPPSSKVQELQNETSNINFRGFYPANEMAALVASSANVMLMLGNFDPDGRRDTELLFPSKLADYTAIGLPILIWAPSYSSAARWATENPGVAELITNTEGNGIEDLVNRLTTRPQYALQFAKRAVETGIRDFSYESIRDILFVNLMTVKV